MATIQTICSKIKKEATIVSESTSKISSATSTETPSVETYSRNSLSAETNQNKLRSKSSDDQLAEMDEVREENGRLKLVLSNMMQDYKTLQQHIGDLGTDHHHQQQEDGNNYSMKYNNDKDADLVVLSLGRSSSLEAKSKDHLQRVGKQEDENLMNHGLALRLDSRSYEYTSSDHNTAGVTKNQSPKKVEEEAANDQTCPSSTKGLKTSRSEDDDENLLQQIPAKKARVSVRAICNAPTMNDGCQWRKYGQKLAKGNPCPRAYYRCTISPSCPVRKHVQRCQDDMSILVTTYEGTHNHPLPPSATAMASTTSAAVSMLKSSSSTSTSQATLSFPSTNSTHNNNRHPFYIPNATISTSQSHPTITLDLTTPSASSRYNKYSSTFLPPQQTTYSPAACLNFSAASSSSSSSFEHWRNRTISSSSSLYRGTQLPPVQTDQAALFYQPYNNYNIPNKNTYVQTHQPQFMEKIADVTKEITSNPSFQSALAAAISSIVGKRGGGNADSLESSLGSVGFGTSYNLSRTSTVVPSVFPQAAGNLKLELPPFSLGKGPVVASSVEKGEHRK